MENTKKKVAVILGSDSDLPVMLGCLKTLIQYQIPYEIHIISAHRTPETAAVFSSSARENGFGVLIAAAGKAAHLAGFLAAHTTLPVIAVPIKSSTLDGLPTEQFHQETMTSSTSDSLYTSTIVPRQSRFTFSTFERLHYNDPVPPRQQSSP